MTGGVADYSGWFQLAWEILFAIALALLTVYSRQIAGLKKSNSARAAEITELRVDFSALEARCLKSEDLTNVHKRVDALTKEVHSMGGRLESVDKSVGIIHDYLLNKKG